MAYREFRNESLYEGTGAMDLAPLERAKAAKDGLEKAKALQKPTKPTYAYPEALRDVADRDKPEVDALRQKTEFGILQKKNAGIPLDQSDYDNMSAYQTAWAKSQNQKFAEDNAAKAFADPLINKRATEGLNPYLAKKLAEREIDPYINEVANKRYKYIDPSMTYDNFGKSVEERGRDSTTPYAGSGSSMTGISGRFIDPATGKFRVNDNQYNAFLAHDNGHAGRMVGYQVAQDLMKTGKGEYKMPDGRVIKSADELFDLAEAGQVPEFDKKRRDEVVKNLKAKYDITTKKAVDVNEDDGFSINFNNGSGGGRNGVSFTPVVGSTMETRDLGTSQGGEPSGVPSTKYGDAGVASANEIGVSSQNYIYKVKSQNMGLATAIKGGAVPVTTSLRDAVALDGAVANSQREQEDKSSSNIVKGTVSRMNVVPIIKDAKGIELTTYMSELGDIGSIDFNNKQQKSELLKKVTDIFVHGESYSKDGKKPNEPHGKAPKYTLKELDNMKFRRFATFRTDDEGNTATSVAEDGKKTRNSRDSEYMIPATQNSDLENSFKSSVNAAGNGNAKAYEFNMAQIEGLLEQARREAIKIRRQEVQGGLKSNKTKKTNTTTAGSVAKWD